MNEDKLLKVEKIKKWFDDKGIFYSEFANGQLQIDGINLWVTSEKWHDPKTNEKGKGINDFMKYLKKSGIA